MITESRAPLDRLVSTEVGIVHRVDAGVTGYDHPRLAAAFVQSCDTGPVLGRAQDSRAGGMATDPARARAAAIGEAAERYSAAHLPVSRLRIAHQRDLGPVPSVAPDWLDRTVAHDRPVRWTPGHRLRAAGAGEPAWIAASRAYLSGDDETGEIAIPTSTGLACHPDPWEALHSGLLEVIERDAVMLTWLTRSAVTPLRSPLRWPAPGGNEIRFDRSIERHELYLLDSPTGIPVVLAAAYGGRGQPPVVVGAAASLDLVQACRRALVEVHQTFVWAGHMMVEGRPIPTTPAEFDDLDQHVAYYLDPARLGAFDFLRSAEGPAHAVDLAAVSPPLPAEQRCRRLIGALAAAGLDCFAVDVTAPDIRAAGLWVIRAVIPDLYPLIVGTTTAPDHPRVGPDVVAARDPHPFP